MLGFWNIVIQLGNIATSNPIIESQSYLSRAYQGGHEASVTLAIRIVPLKSKLGQISPQHACIP